MQNNQRTLWRAGQKENPTCERASQFATMDSTVTPQNPIEQKDRVDFNFDGLKTSKYTTRTHREFVTKGDRRLEPPDAMLGQTILSRFKVVRQLTPGGMGRVYLTKDLHFSPNDDLDFEPERDNGFLRVLKFPLLDQSPDSPTRFVREANNLATLSIHPNIVTLLDKGTHELSPIGDRAPCLITEYCRCDFADVLSRNGPFAFDVFLEVARGLADALAFAHSKQICHRDIKLRNIFQSFTGIPKLGDFGMSRHLDDTRLQSSNGRFLGTLAFTAPEVLRRMPFDESSDVFSLGVVFWWFLFNRDPWPDSPDIAATDVTTRDGEIIRAQIIETTRLIPPPELENIKMDKEKREDFFSFLCKMVAPTNPSSRPGAIDVLDTLQSMKAHYTLFGESDAKLVIHMDRLKMIRQATSMKIRIAIESLAQIPTVQPPRAFKDSEWCATILVRPWTNESVPAEYFQPVFIACLRWDKIHYSSNWVLTPALVENPASRFLVQNCCSGLAVERYNEENTFHALDGAENGYCEAWDEGYNMLRYVAVENIQKAISKPTTPWEHFVKERYATPSKLGWRLMSEFDSSMMEKDLVITSGVYVPLYAPHVLRAKVGKREDVLGVAVCEWAGARAQKGQAAFRKLLRTRAEAVAEFFHDSQMFSMSEYLCEVVQQSSISRVQ